MASASIDCEALPVLSFPEEPRALRAETRSLLQRAPAAGQQVLEAGEWIAAPLWEIWRDPLEGRGMPRQRFVEIVASYRNELRLWVMGERPWDHCLVGLIGRISRRVPDGEDLVRDICLSGEQDGRRHLAGEQPAEPHRGRRAAGARPLQPVPAIEDQ